MEIKVGSHVTHKNDSMPCGIFRVAELSMCGRKARIVSEARMLDLGWINVERLALAVPEKNGMTAGQTVLFAGRVPVRITRFARNGVWIEYWGRGLMEGKYVRERVSISVLSK